MQTTKQRYQSWKSPHPIPSCISMKGEIRSWRSSLKEKCKTNKIKLANGCNRQNSSLWVKTKCSISIKTLMIFKIFELIAIFSMNFYINLRESLISLLLKEIFLFSKNQNPNKSELNGHLVSWEVSFNEFPVDQVAEVLQILSPGVSVINVISVFPNVNG